VASEAGLTSLLGTTKINYDQIMIIPEQKMIRE